MTLEEAQEVLSDINKTISKMDPSVREKAFDVLVRVAFSETEEHRRPDNPRPREHGGTNSNPTPKPTDLGDFVSKFDHSKPSDNVKLLVAWLYSQYGKFAFSPDEIKALAAETGLTIPDRLDMTFRGSKKDGKSIFTSPRRAHWQLTTVGELAIKDAYDISKGTKPRPAEGDE